MQIKKIEIPEIPFFSTFYEPGVPDHKAPRIPDGVLAQASARFPIPCTDIVFIDKDGCMILAYRRHAAARGWWWFGGAMTTGMSMEDNLARILTREIGFVPEGIRLVGMFPHVWATCRERPGQRRDDLLFLHAVQVDDDTIGKIRLDPKEYRADKGLLRFNGRRRRLRPVLYAAHKQLRTMGMAA